MQTQVFNRHLCKKWSDQENLIMSKKLSSVKAAIKIQCPESFVFSKSLKKPSNIENSKLILIKLVRNFEIKKNNMILGNNIVRIYEGTDLGKRKIFLFVCNRQEKER